MADVPGAGPVPAEVPALDEKVGGEDDPPVRTRHDRRVVAGTHEDAFAHRQVANERVDQLVRAAESILRNIGEGHPTVGADRARRFRIAANEASECAASLDILEVRGEIMRERLEELRGLLDRIRAMLWKLSRPR